jgi:single-stranded DNA-binding protein
LLGSFPADFCLLCTPTTLTMSSFNNGTIIGTIVSDIIRKTPTDSLSVTEFRIAPSNAKDDDSPLPVVAYNGVGERISQRMNKGDTVGVEFRLRYSTWQDQEGNPRGRMEVVVTSCDMLRLGKISTAQRAAEAAGVIETTGGIKPKAAAVPFSGEPTAEVIPF